MVAGDIKVTYLCVTWGERVTEVCSGNSNEIELTVGTYQLEWGGECFISTAHWTISGVIHKSMAERIAILETWNITNFDLPKIVGGNNFTHRLDLPNRLSDPKVIRLNSPKFVYNEFNDHHNSSYYYYFILLIIPIIIIISIMLYVRFLRHKHNNVDGTADNVSTTDDSKTTFRLRVLTTKSENV